MKPNRMKLPILSRRQFLLATGASAFTALSGCGVEVESITTDNSGPTDTQVDEEDVVEIRTPGVAYRLSARGKRASNASKANAANKIFATAEAADRGRAHPGDKSAIVPLDMSEDEWSFYFVDGAPVVDLREFKSLSKVARRLWGVKQPFEFTTLPVDADYLSEVVALRLTNYTKYAIDKTWLNLPLLNAPGEYPATVSLPHGTLVPFVLAIAPECRLEDEVFARRDRLEALTLRIGVLVGVDGKLFGSVTTLQLSEAFLQLGETVDRRLISLPGDINTLGVYEATVSLSCAVIAKVQLEVLEA